jgi:hypothetical protein
VLVDWDCGAELSEAVPGPVLATLLARTVVADCSEFMLVEVAAAAERMIAWAASVQAAAVSEQLARIPSASAELHTTTTLTATLGVTRFAAEKRIRVAVACDQYPALASNLRTGVLDVDKVLALAETGTLPVTVRTQVIDALMDRAPSLTHRQLADQVRRAELIIDPAGGLARHVKARATRSVCLQPSDDAMAWITALLPADDAARTWATIDATARVMRATPGETRKLDECRADALVALTLGQILITPDPVPHTAPNTVPNTVPDAALGAVPDAQPGAARDTTPGAIPDTRPGVVPGTAVGTVEGAAAGVGVGGLPGTGDAPPVPAVRVPQVRVPQVGVPQVRVPQVRVPQVGVRQVGVPAVRVPRVHVGVLVAASTLAGLDDLPGEIIGYGPVPADIAALLATTTNHAAAYGDNMATNGDAARDDEPASTTTDRSTPSRSTPSRSAPSRSTPSRASGFDVTWRRLLTDPCSGVLTDFSTTAYRPGAVLRQAVQARDRQCTFIGCRQPAYTGELDHITAFDHTRPHTRDVQGRGQTWAGNLHPLCKAHHQAKTAGLIEPVRTPDGHTIWHVAATGHLAWRYCDPLHPAVVLDQLGITRRPATPTATSATADGPTTTGGASAAATSTSIMDDGPAPPF